MEYVVGLVLGVVVAGFAAAIGFDRDRAFYPTVLIVVASYSSLFAVMGASGYPVLGVEIAIGLVFSLLAAVGFKRSMWLVAAGIAGHGAFDFVHHLVVENPGMPVWWPGFCGTIDIVMGGWLGVCLLRRAKKQEWQGTPRHWLELKRKGNQMKLKLNAHIVLLAAAYALASPGYAKPSSCPLGTLLDVQEDTEYVPTVQFGRVHRSGSKDWTTVEMPSSRKQTTYTIKVALEGIIYTARSSGDFWGYNPSHMVVNSELAACVEANKLVITRPDGKQYKPTIIRRERR